MQIPTCTIFQIIRLRDAAELDLDGEIRQPQQSVKLENPALVAGQAQVGNVAGGVKAPAPPPPPSGQVMGYGSTGASEASMQAGGQGGTPSALAASAVPPPAMRTDVVGMASSVSPPVDGLLGQGVHEAQTLTTQVPQQNEAQPQHGAQWHLEGQPKAPSVRVTVGGQGFFAQGVQWMLQRFAEVGGQEVLVTQPSSQTAQTEYQTPVTPKSLFSPEQMRRFAQLEEQAPQLYQHVAGPVGQVASPPSSASLSMEVIQAEVRRQVERELEGRNRRLRELEEENRRLREGNVGSIAPAAPPKVNANRLGGFLGGLLPGSGGFWANASRSSPAPPPPPPLHSPSVLLPPPLPPHPSLQSASYGSVASGHPPSGARPPSYPSGLVPGVPSWVLPLASASEHAVQNPNPSYPSGLVPGVPGGVLPLASASGHTVQNPNPSYPSGLVPAGVPSTSAQPAHDQQAPSPCPSGYPSGLGPNDPSGWQAYAAQQGAVDAVKGGGATYPAAPIAPSPATLPIERSGERATGVESLGSNSLELLIAGMRQLQEVSKGAWISPEQAQTSDEVW